MIGEYPHFLEQGKGSNAEIYQNFVIWTWIELSCMAKETDKSLAFGKLASSGEKGASGNNHLLLIGIDQYQQVGQLANAVRDAQTFRDLLLKKYTFSADYLTEVYDSKASRRQIMRGLRLMINQVKPGDNLIVYFSGHGHYDEAIEEGYWVPVDAEYDEIDAYISYSFLTKIIKAIPSRHTVFIVDSCYSGAALVRERDLKVERFDRDPSRWLLASGRNEVVPDGIAGQHSPFADKLLDILDRYAHEGLRMGTLVDKLTTAVTYNSRQTPIGRPLYEVGDQGGEFVFYPRQHEAEDWAGARSTHTVVTYERFLKAYPESVNRESASWAIALIRDSIVGFRRYLNAYAAGTYAHEAIERMDELEEKQVFEQAKNRGEAALRRYLLKYSAQGRYLSEAREEIERIEQGHNERLLEQEADKKHREREALEKQKVKQEAERRQTPASIQENFPKSTIPEKEKDDPNPRKINLLDLFLNLGVILLTIAMLVGGVWWLWPEVVSTETDQGTPGTALDSSYTVPDEALPNVPAEQSETKPNSTEEEFGTESALDRLRREHGLKIVSAWVQDVAIFRLPDNAMGLINRKGEYLGKKYGKVEDLAHGYAVFHQSGKRGYLDLKGREVIPAQYAAAWAFTNNGQAKVKEGNRVFYIDSQGECARDCETSGQIPLPNMIRISGGAFTMGSSDGESDERPHQVTVSAFYLAETEVTFAQYDYFCEQTGRKKPEDQDWGKRRGDRPVISVSWDDATAYCKWLSKETRQRYRLPTEAEWEYAAGGGTSGRTKWAGTDSDARLGSYAVYGGSKTAEVKSKSSNRLGLYDMSGNVWEWCQDRYGNYSAGPQTNPQGPDSGSGRVIRGGGWGYGSGFCRVANRFSYSPTYRSYNLGFRLAR